MRFFAIFIAFCIAGAIVAGTTGCVTPVYDPETQELSVGVSPVASLSRLKKSEDMFNEAITKINESIIVLSEGQAELARQLQNEAVALKAEAEALKIQAAEERREFQQKILEMQDQMSVDWTQIILVAFGAGATGTGATGGVMAYRKRLKNTPAPEQKVA